MLAPLVLVFVLSSDADTEATRALVAAVAQTLGADVSLERYQGAPPAAATLAESARVRGAVGAARVTWLGADETRATLLLHQAREDGPVYRELTFQAQDAPADRGRAVGLVLASLLRPNAPAAPAPSTSATIAAAPAVTQAPEPWAIEGFAGGGLAFGGHGDGVGGGLALRRYGPAGWGARVGAHARTGSVAVAQASALALGLSLGGFRRLIGEDQARPTWDLGARGELILLYEALTHFSADDPQPVRRGRFLPGAAALLEGQWRISRAATLHLAVGAEVALGTTRVLVRGAEVAVLAPVRGIMELGFRARF